MNNETLLIPYKEVDYLSEARDKYTLAFEDKVVFDKYIRLVTDEVLELQKTLKELTQLRTLEEAFGYHLDIIGAIVGQPRILREVDLYDYFGMRGYPGSKSMGTLNNPSLGGLFFDLNDRGKGSVTLDDVTYRIMIRAKIAKNITRATPEDLMWYLNFVFGTSSSFASEGNAHVVALISSYLSPEQTLLLNYINREGRYDVTLFPKPVGVNIEYGTYNPDSFFAFTEITDAKGFGDLYDPHVDGGIFSSIFPDIGTGPIDPEPSNIRDTWNGDLRTLFDGRIRTIWDS